MGGVWDKVGLCNVKVGAAVGMRAMRKGCLSGCLDSLTKVDGGIMLLMAAKSLQSCPTLCDPMDGSPPGSPIPGILQARTLEWVAISFSNA